MKKISLTCIIILSTMVILAQEYGVIKNYFQISKSSGLANNNVTEICSDIYDRIWIGTSEGLNIYDSKRTVDVSRYNGLRIFSLFSTKTEMLVGVAEYLEAYNYETGQYTRVRHRGSDVSYTTSIIQVDHEIVVLAGKKIYKYKEGQLELIQKHAPYNDISVDKFGTIWAINYDQVSRLDKDFNLINTYTPKNHDLSPLIILCIFPDSIGSVWIGTKKDGLFRYNRTDDKFLKEDVTRKFGIKEIENIGSIHEDRYHGLWIGHNNGITVYDYTNNSLKNYILENSDGIAQNTTVTSLYRIPSGNMVVGTYFTGFIFINELSSRIKFKNLSDSKNTLGNVAANGIVKDYNDRLWVATNYTGINILDSKENTLKQLNQSSYPINNNIVSLSLDKSGDIWAGSLSNGLYRITPNYQIRHYVNNPNDSNSLSGSSIDAIFVINADSVAIASNKGIDFYLNASNSFTNLLKTDNTDFTFCQILSHEDNIYFINFNSIITYNRTTKKTGVYGPKSQPNIYIQSAYCNNKGELLLGTTQGDIYLFKDERIESYITKSRIRNSIAGIQDDSNGNLWVTAGNSIYRISPNKEILKTNLAWGLGNSEFNIRSSFKDDDRIYFGTYNGLISFDPLSMNTTDKTQTKPKLYIADFKVLNKSVIPDPDGLLHEHVNTVKNIKLENDQNFISFEIVPISYDEKQAYYKCFYRLKGLDDNWYEMSPSASEISFTGLTFGHYTLEIKLETTDQQIIDSRAIIIQILPPFYFKPYMILGYMVIALFILWGVYRFVQKQRNAKKQIENAKREQEEIKKLNAMKLDFFTHISHEFKTPLAVLSTLEDDVLIREEDKEVEVNIFKRNIKRLEYLINQLMDFRNIESQYATIQLDKYDIVSFTKDLFEAFSPLCRQKAITYEFIPEIDRLPLVFDADKLEMLIGNLLSNGVKHTEYGGRCSLKLYTHQDNVIIEIFNTAKCFSDDQKIAIFQPYNKTNISGPYSNSGIGLAIVNSIAKLLGIDLSVISVPNEGNIFRVALSIVEDADMEVNPTNSRSSIVKQIIDNTRYIEEQGLFDTTPENEDKSNFQVLIVEDDSDTKKILKRKLNEYFYTLVASSAEEALLLLKTRDVDVIISDVQMPNMSGYEFCQTLKSNPKFKHIPVILITSERSSEGKIKGFQCGADVYMQKPIHMQELLLRLSNILKSKDTLRSYYSDFTGLHIETAEINNADETFIKKITEYIHNNLEKTELSVGQLAQEANVSRTQLYLNIKRLTGDTPSTFILKIKMEKAKRLLLSTSLTSAEISHRLGYYNPNHFSRQFKEFYGSSPTEFKKTNILG